MSENMFKSSRKRSLIGLISVLAASLLVLALVLFTPSPAPAEPTITWTPASVTETILPGETKSLVVSFMTSENVNNALVRVVPELQPFVQVSPSEFGSIAQGDTVELNVTISSPPSSIPGTFQGTIQLRSGSGGSTQAFARPLPFTLNVTWPLFESADLGISVAHSPEYLATQQPPLSQLDASAELQGVVSIEKPEDLPGTFLVEIYDNSSGLPVDEWFQSFKEESLFQAATDLVSNNSFLGPTVAREFASESATKLGIFAARDGKIYALEWLSYDPADTERLATFRVMQASFSFR